MAGPCHSLVEQDAAGFVRRPVALFTCLLIQGCAVDAEPITESPVGDLTITEIRRIGATEADLSSVGSMLVASNGDLLVTQMEDNVIRVFTISGDSRTIGGDGEGPGEFRRLTRAGWVGDSVWVLDPDLSRVTIFDPRYELVRSFAMPLAIKSEVGDSVPVELYVQAVLPGGALRAIAFIPRGVTPPAWAADVDSGSTHYVRLGEDGRYLGRILLVPPDRCRVSYAIGSSGHGTATHPFCASPVSTDWLATAGMAIAQPDPTGPDSTAVRLTVLGPAGDTLMHRQLLFANLPVSPEARDSQAQRRAAMLANRPPASRAAMPELQPASTWPPVRSVLLGIDGTVWLEVEELDPAHRWKVFSSSGEVIGFVTTPGNFTIRVASRSTVWGVETDADDLQSIVAYRID